MTFVHPLARSAKVFTAHHRDGTQQILAIVTTLELDPRGEHYKKRFVDKLSDAARDYVSRSDHVSAFMLMNRPKDWLQHAKAPHNHQGGPDTMSVHASIP